MELKDPGHPGSVVARRVKQHLTDSFRAELDSAGVADPETLAAQWTIVFDGAGTRAVVRAQALSGIGTTAALLDAAGVGRTGTAR